MTLSPPEPAAELLPYLGRLKCPGPYCIKGTHYSNREDFKVAAEVEDYGPGVLEAWTDPNTGTMERPERTMPEGSRGVACVGTGEVPDLSPRSMAVALLLLADSRGPAADERQAALGWATIYVGDMYAEHGAALTRQVEEIAKDVHWSVNDGRRTD